MVLPKHTDDPTICQIRRAVLAAAAGGSSTAAAVELDPHPAWWARVRELEEQVAAIRARAYRCEPDDEILRVEHETDELLGHAHDLRRQILEKPATTIEGARVQAACLADGMSEIVHEPHWTAAAQNLVTFLDQLGRT